MFSKSLKPLTPILCVVCVCVCVCVCREWNVYIFQYAVMAFCLTYRYLVIGSLQDASSPHCKITMIIHRLIRFSSDVQLAVSIHLQRNIGASAVAFNKELDAIQKIFMDKIREFEYKCQASGRPVDTNPEYQQDLEKDLFKIKQIYGKADMNTFPSFQFEDSKFEVIKKPQA